MMTQTFFTTTGIPQVLEPRPEAAQRFMTLEQVETIMEHNDRAILPVAGDCMERTGIVDGGWVAVDFTRRPAPPRHKSNGGDGNKDICMCYVAYPGQRRPAVMCKSYLGLWGTWHMVGTRYDLSKGKHKMNCGMDTIKIFGVVYVSWDADGKLLWQRDPASFPSELGTTPTITGGNVGNPMQLSEVFLSGGRESA